MLSGQLLWRGGERDRIRQWEKLSRDAGPATALTNAMASSGAGVACRFVPNWTEMASLSVIPHGSVTGCGPSWEGDMTLLEVAP